MQITFLLYPGFTPLDAMGPYQVLAAVPGAAPCFVAESAGPAPTGTVLAGLAAAARTGCRPNLRRARDACCCYQRRPVGGGSFCA